MGNNNQLKSIVERIEKLEEEKAAIAADVKDALLEAKSNGFDTKIIKKILALRKQDAAKKRGAGSSGRLYGCSGHAGGHPWEKQRWIARQISRQ